MNTSVIILGLFILLLFVENQRERNKMYKSVIKDLANYWHDDIEVKKAILEEIEKQGL